MAKSEGDAYPFFKRDFGACSSAPDLHSFQKLLLVSCCKGLAGALPWLVTMTNFLLWDWIERRLHDAHVRQPIHLAIHQTLAATVVI
jgi:hypothetical protein